MSTFSSILVAALAATLLTPVTASAKEIQFSATLSGASPSGATGSAATGTATVLVDLDANTVALTMDVAGITREQLWDKLVGAPIGPVHLHQYASADVTDPNGSSLAFPVPYDASYADTTVGFRVATGPIAYVDGAAMVGSDATFADFVAKLQSGAIVLNIHTDTFNPGEISGVVTAAE